MLTVTRILYIFPKSHNRSKYTARHLIFEKYYIVFAHLFLTICIVESFLVHEIVFILIGLKNLDHRDAQRVNGQQISNLYVFARISLRA